MHTSEDTARRAGVAALGFSLLFALIAGCAGPKADPKTPMSSSADLVSPPSASGSATQDQAPPEKVATVNTSTVSNTSDGSDIIPPFSGSKDATDKKSGGKKGAKKGAARGAKKKT